MTDPVCKGDCIHDEHCWRFWNHKALELAEANTALREARAQAYREGQERMRERCAEVCDRASAFWREVNKTATGEGRSESYYRISESEDHAKVLRQLEPEDLDQ